MIVFVIKITKFYLKNVFCVKLVTEADNKVENCYY